MPIKVTTDETEARPVTPAMLHGLACKCPHCGKGRLFRAYLKTNDHCPECGEELFHHRADDLPPYISIVIIGHLLVGLMLHMEMSSTGSPVTYMGILLPLAIVLPLASLPSIKGAVVGLQWALRMHGFNPDVEDRI